MNAQTCPQCGKEMLSGYVFAPLGIHWLSKSQKPPIFHPVWRALPKTLNWRLRRRENPAWHCDQCQMLIVDHSQSLPLRRRS